MRPTHGLSAGPTPAIHRSRAPRWPGSSASPQATLISASAGGLAGARRGLGAPSPAPSVEHCHLAFSQRRPSTESWGGTRGPLLGRRGGPERTRTRHLLGGLCLLRRPDGAAGEIPAQAKMDGSPGSQGHHFPPLVPPTGPSHSGLAPCPRDPCAHGAPTRPRCSARGPARPGGRGPRSRFLAQRDPASPVAFECLRAWRCMFCCVCFF